MDQIIIYQSEDGRTKLDVRLEDQTVWLNQKQLTELFGKAKGTISEHISNILEDKELDEASTVRLFRTVQKEGGREVVREVECYNLDMVLALGFRVRSPVVSAELARIHAEREFVEFRKIEDRSLESDFDRAVKQLPPQTKDKL